MNENLRRILRVRNLAGEDQRSVAHLLGRPLDDDQQLYILAFKPGTIPDEAARQRGLASMQEGFSKAQQHAQRHGVTESQIDEAVEEATDRVRYAKP
jgi:hypothetical protein